MTTTTDVAVRNGAPAAYQQAALAIKPGQTTWDKYQDAALAQIGLKDAPNADRAVFLHQCQRTGLDPFSRQIYMIGRAEKQKDGSWGIKWTIQTGIDGWRVIRDRAERREGVRGILSRFTYYDHDDNEKKVWTRPEPPAAIEVTYTVRDRNNVETPYTSILRHDEYVQTNKDGQPVAKWATMDVHMLEKCTEADVYRKAFPQDFSGIHLEDAMPRPEDMPQPPQRVTAEEIRSRPRQPQRAQAAVVEDPAPPAEDVPAHDDDPRAAVHGHLNRLGIAGHESRMEYAGSLLGTAPPASLDGLARAEAVQLAGILAQCAAKPDVDALLEAGEVPGE